VILLPLVDRTESAVVFVARTFDMIWIGAPVKIVKDTSVNPRAKITRINAGLCFCIISRNGIDYLYFMNE
jgi:hypothetical protein